GVASLGGGAGGRSSARRQLGIRYAGWETLQQAYLGGRMISSHIRMPTFYRDILGNRRAFQPWAINSQSRAQLGALDGREEFLLFMRASGPETAPDPEEVRRTVVTCCGAELPVDVIGSQPWTAGVALVAERFGEGRVLLTG